MIRQRIRTLLDNASLALDPQRPKELHVEGNYSRVISLPHGLNANSIHANRSDLGGHLITAGINFSELTQVFHSTAGAHVWTDMGAVFDIISFSGINPVGTSVELLVGDVTGVPHTWLAPKINFVWNGVANDLVFNGSFAVRGRWIQFVVAGVVNAYIAAYALPNR